jgi:hypothetical protein
MHRRHKLALWAILGAVALAAAWVVWPGVMAWRMRSVLYTTNMRHCVADASGNGWNADQARQYCYTEVRP